MVQAPGTTNPLSGRIQSQELYSKMASLKTVETSLNLFARLRWFKLVKPVLQSDQLKSAQNLSKTSQQRKHKGH